MEGDRILLTYIGRRISRNKDKLYYAYLKQGDEGSYTYYFGRPLKNTPTNIGLTFEVTETEDGVKSPYDLKLDFKAPESLVQKWYSESSVSVMEFNQFRALAKLPERDVKELKRQIRYLTSNMSRNQRLAFIMSLMFTD